MQQFYRPGGDSTQLRGVVSDIELPSLTTHLDVGEADFDYPLHFDQVPAQPIKKFDRINPSLIDQLRRASAARCAASEKFQKVERNIAHYLAAEGQEGRHAQRGQVPQGAGRANADKEEEKAIEKLNNDPSGIDRDFYLDEVFNITTDYMNQAQVVKAN